MTQRPARGAARLAAILDSLPDALLLVDGRGLVVNANARALDMFETPAGPLVGKPVSSVLPEFDRPKAMGRGRRRKERRGERSERERGDARRTDGTTFPSEISTSLLPGHADDDLLVLVVRAVAEEETHQAELARQQRLMETILRAATEAIIGVDNSGKIILANPAAARLLRTKAADLAGKDLHEVAHHSKDDGSPNPRDGSPLTETLQTGQPVRGRGITLWRRDDADPIWVEMSIVPVTTDDVLSGAIVTYTDRADLQWAKARHDELVHMLRRELGRPLRRARNEIRRVAAGEYGSLSEPSAGALDEIAAGLDRLVRVIGDALEQERTQGQEAIGGRTDAHKLVQLAVDAVNSNAERAGVLISTDADPVEVALDEDRCVQALSTVLSTALRSAPLGSTITMSAKQRGDRLRIVINGPGTGSPPRIAERDIVGGPPLDVGIPVARRLVEQLGGTMTIRSSPADGTRCTIELPLTATATDLAEPALAAPVPPTPAVQPQAELGADSLLGATVDEPTSTERDAGQDPVEPELSAPAAAADQVELPAQRAVEAPTTLTSLPAVSSSLPALPPTVLVWPQPHEATTAALRGKGWQAVPVATPHDLTAYLPRRPAALLVDPLTGPVTRTALQAVRSAAAEAAVPLLVAAGIGEVAADALYGSDPAALLRALTPHGRKNGRAARVLLIEGDAALATTFGARLERRGMEVIHATSESEAVLRAAITQPDLVVVDLMLTRTSGPGIVDWLRLHDRLPVTPIVAYTTSSLTPDAYERLRRGQSALFLQGRSETADVEDRITLLVERMTTTL